MPPVPASSVAFIVVVLQQYTLHRWWTFRSRQPHSKSIPLYIGTTVVGFLINYTVMHLGTEWLGVNYLITQFIAIVLVTCWNYVLSVKIVFAKRSRIS